uniref:Putative portal protein n=1 Tax=viral metagenome TaxID=1070528 RepID=A0A6M3KSS0_9ZZZZ
MPINNFFHRFFHTKSDNSFGMQTKFQKVEDHSTPYTLITGDYQKNKPKYTADDLLRLNKNWVSICNRKNALMVATTKLNLYYKKNAGESLITPNKRVEKQIRGITCKANEELVEIEKHPILELLDSVNAEMNYVDFCTFIQEYLGILGNAYVYVERKGSKPVSLHPLLSEKVTVVLEHNKDGTSYIKEYKYFDKKIYQPEDIIRFINYSPGQLVAGRGDLEYCVDAAERYDYYDQLEKGLNKNNARGDYLLSYKQRPSERDRRDLLNDLYKNFSGPENAGKPIVTSDATITPLSFSPRDMQYQVGRQWAMDEIASVFGVPNVLLNLRETNYAAAAASMNFYLQTTIYPKLAQYCNRLNEFLVPQFDNTGKLKLWYEDEIKEEPLEESNVLRNYVSAGIMTKNEARERLGLPPLVEPEDSEDLATPKEKEELEEEENKNGTR